MPLDPALRRMTLRQLITHAEKSSRNVIEQLHSTLLAQISDFRDLSRPVRRRSHYPTMVALHHGLQNLLAANQELKNMTDDLHVQLDEIRERANKERVSRQ
ncbi:MAG TPA: hypothetical protein VE988_13935 [Gemmataceae bacterium]|nr:hypothetical protein [Gemmataceae bacterium]